jgi:23S rRNA (pseudouridine1915-N3)-methyltransferase
MQKGLVVVFDEKGACWNSKKWAQHIPIWTHAPQISFIVGPAYGLDKRWSQMASLTLSLSPLTLNHELAQVLVAEQLYRAWAIEKNWPYHQD